MAKKSDELIFDSERQAQKEHRQRMLLPLLIVLALVVLLVVAIILIRSNKTERVRMGEGSPYPFSWSQEKDGTLSLYLTHASQPDHRWAVGTDMEESPTVSLQRAEKEQEDSTVFVLTPKEAGRALLKFELLREENPDDVVYELNLQTETMDAGEGKTSLRVLGFAGLQRQISLPEEAAADESLNLGIQSDGLLCVSFPIQKGQIDWYAESSDEETVLPVELTSADNVLTAYLRGGEKPGEAKVTFHSDYAGQEMILTVQCREDGSLQVLSKEIVTIEKLPSPDDPDTEFVLETDEEGGVMVTAVADVNPGDPDYVEIEDTQASDQTPAETQTDVEAPSDTQAP